MSFSVDISPAVLQWARESAGYSVPDVAERCRIPENVVQGWEIGAPRPTWSALRKLAKLYRRPVESLLRAAPPQEPPPPTDYRTLPDAKNRFSPKTRFTIRTARWLARTGRELERQLGIERGLEMPRVRLADDPEDVAQVVRASLGVTIAQQSSWKTVGEALRQWRAATEAQRIFAFQFRMPIEELRGFSLLEEERPVIVLNQADGISARIFTLFHEYAHLASARPGVCIPEERLIGQSQQVETFCNRVAAAFLIPRSDFEQQMPNVPSDGAINRLTRRYWVSRYVVLGRMHTLGAVSRDTYQEITRRWERREVLAPAPMTAQRGGLSRTARCLSQRGPLFVSVVVEAARREYIPANDAIGYLGVRVKDLRRLVSKVK